MTESLTVEPSVRCLDIKREPFDGMWADIALGEERDSNGSITVTVTSPARLETTGKGERSASKFVVEVPRLEMREFNES